MVLGNAQVPGPLVLSALVKLRTGKSYGCWEFSGLLCFTEKASGSLKLHNFWDLKCWFEGGMCVHVCKTQIGWPEAWMIHTWSALALDWGGQVLQSLDNSTLRYGNVWLWWYLLFTLCKAQRWLIGVSHGFGRLMNSWNWEGNKRRKQWRGKKTMVKKWKAKASGNKERI